MDNFLKSLSEAARGNRGKNSITGLNEYGQSEPFPNGGGQNHQNRQNQPPQGVPEPIGEPAEPWEPPKSLAELKQVTTEIVRRLQQIVARTNDLNTLRYIYDTFSTDEDFVELIDPTGKLFGWG